MILHQLQLCAFGPFPDEQKVDFDALSADGLFLLRGRTGAGKTSILDAITFALYGDVPGERDRAMLKSRHAPAQREPYVRLEFTAQGRRWRVRRTPQHERPQQRDAARMRQHNQSVTLECFDGAEYQPVTSGVQAASDELRRIIGLDLAQFTQVILLPQGAFAQFLHASSKDKQQLLEKLFDTRRFRLLEEYLRVAARETQQQVDQLNTQVHTLAAGLQRESSALEEAAVELPQTSVAAAEESVPPVVSESEPENLHQVTVARAGYWMQQATAALKRATGMQRATAQQLEALQAAQRELRAYQQYQQAVETHQQQLPAIEKRRAELAADRSGRAVAQWLKSADEAHAQHQKLQQQAKHSVTELHRCWQDQTDLPQDLLEDDSYEPAREALIALRTQVQQAKPLQQQITEITAQRTKIQREITELERQVGTYTAQEAQLRTSIEELKTQLIDTEELEQQRQLAAEQLQETQRILELVTTRNDQQKQLGQARTAQLQSEGALHDAQKQYRQVAGAYLGSIAAELAEGLTEGQPCLVCGSEDHPHPHQPEVTSTTREDVEAARAHQENNASDDAVARSRLQHCEEAVAVTDKQLGDHASLQLEEAAEQVQHAKDKHSELTVRRRYQDQLREQLTESTHQLEEERRRLLQTQQRTESQQREEALLRQTFQQQETELAALRGNHESVESRLEALGQLEDSVQQAQHSQQQAKAAAQRAEQTQAEATARWKESNFSAEDQVHAAILDNAQRQNAEEQITAYDAEAARLALQAESAEVTAGAQRHTAGQVPPTHQALEQAGKELTIAESASESARELLSGLRVRQQSVEASAQQLQQALAAREELATEQIERAELAATINGGGDENPLRMSLTTYVLAAQLERVAEAATRHLAVMSEGRYQLLHDDEKRGRGQQGLDLKVYDEHADDQRPASSLSGGETFMTSLAMALGLAEVVQADAGGVSMETLFIDEGFGSLDENTLDAVMTALRTLEGEGRRVGVVSHVSEMHQQIPSQLEAVRGRSGSTIRMHTP